MPSQSQKIVAISFPRQYLYNKKPNDADTGLKISLYSFIFEQSNKYNMKNQWYKKL